MGRGVFVVGFVRGGAGLLLVVVLFLLGRGARQGSAGGLAIRRVLILRGESALLTGVSWDDETRLIPLVGCLPFSYQAGLILMMGRR
jgi:hypothetical protein